MKRREFLATLAAPVLLGGCKGLFNIGYASPRRVNPSDRVNLAIIGCGTQAYDNVNQFLQDPRAQITLVCDPVTHAETGYSYDAKRPGGCIPFKNKIDEWYKNKSCRMTNDWREVVSDPTIDAVVICTPDHWHAIIGIAAMKAGKHVYCQKPLTLSIEEGIVMTRVAKETGVTFQTGNQGRSSSAKRVACELVRSGYIGECKYCFIGIPGGSGGAWGHPAVTERGKIPSYFNEDTWNLWQGPAEHWENNAFIHGIHEPMAWRWNRRYGNGMIADFSPHELDTLQWALGMETSGPVAIENCKFGNWQPDRSVFSWAGEYEFDLVYANGFRAHVVSMREGVPRGLQFKGSKGELKNINGSLELPPELRKWNEKRDLKDTDVHLYKPKDGHSHESDFLDGIYEQRQVNSTCEIGHRTNTLAQLANICQRLGLSGAKWDPVAERFVGNDAANKLLSVDYHNGWKLI